MKVVPRVTSYAQLQHYIEQHQPCIYSLPNTTLLQLERFQSKDYFIREYGSTEVTVRSSPTKCYINPSDPFWSIVKSLLSTRMSLKAFLDIHLQEGKIISGTDTYLYHKNKSAKAWGALGSQSFDLLHVNDDILTSSIPTPHATVAFSNQLYKGAHSDQKSIIPLDSITTVGFWLSGNGIRSMLHYDTSKDHNLNIQLSGKKRITLFPPGDWSKLNTFLAMGLHSFETYDVLHQHSIKEVSTMHDYPLQGTNSHIAELQQGDALFIPSQWYHYVEHRDEFNVNITYWFHSIFSTSTTVTANPEVLKRHDKPSQSSRDLLLIFRLLFCFVTAVILSLLNKCTHSQIGHSLCDRNLN